MAATRSKSKARRRRKSTAKKPTITQKELKAIERKAREAEKAAQAATKAYKQAQADYKEKRKEQQRRIIQRRIERTGSRYTKKEQKRREAAARKREKERIKTYKTHLTQLQRFGVYIPKDSELTAYRKRQINKRYKEFERYLDPRKFFFVPFGNNRTAKRRAKQLGMVESQTGVFVEKKGGQKTAKIKYDSKLRADVIEVTGFTKKGKRKGRKYTETLPLASIDQIAVEKERLRKALFSNHPLKKNEAIAIGIADKNDGDEPTWMYTLFKRTGHTEKDFEPVWRHILNYRKTTQQQIEFLRHIIFMKVDIKEFGPTLREQRGKARYGRVGKVNAKGRNT